MDNDMVVGKKVVVDRSSLIGLLFFIPFVFFQVFNYSVTDYALRDLLGGLAILGIGWNVILATAFCAIDLYIVVNFLVADKTEMHSELFGAWLIAVSMNAGLTWWGINLALVNHPIDNSIVMHLQGAIPIFVAFIAWTIRIVFMGVSLLVRLKSNS